MRHREYYPGEYVSGYGNTRRTHILMAEKAIGRQIPNGACVHHVNENPADNSPGNLVLCPSAAYHKLLHRRADALRECGHADWMKCAYCKKYDDPQNLSVKTRMVRKSKTALVYHRACNTARQSSYNAKLRAKRTDWMRGPRSDKTRAKISKTWLRKWEAPRGHVE